MSVGARTRSAEWKVSYLQKKDHIAVYLGQWHVGSIRWTTKCPVHRTPHYAGYVGLPGMVGPVVQSTDLHEAKIAVTLKVKEWTQGMIATPSDHEEREETQTVRVVRRRRTPEGE